MSDGSVSDSDAEFIDLTGDDNSHPGINGHENPASDQEEISLGVDSHGGQIRHIIYRPPDPMDIGDENSSSYNGQNSSELEGSLFVENDGRDDDGEGNGPPSPPSSDELDNDSDGSNTTNDDLDSEDREMSLPLQPNLGTSNGGSPGGNDPGGDDSDGDDSDNDHDSDIDNDSINDDDEEGDQQHSGKNPNADVAQVLEEEQIVGPEWDGACLETCQPSWDNLTRKFATYRNEFLRKRYALKECKRVNRKRVTDLNRELRPLRQQNPSLIAAVKEFYAANQTNIAENERLREENEELRNLLPPHQLANFPQPIPLLYDEMMAHLPQEMHADLPPDVQGCVRIWKRALGRNRKTNRTWMNEYRQWLDDSSESAYENWGDIYKLSCKEENMSWAFGERRVPKTHPHLKLRAPTDEEEAEALKGETEACTPRSDCGALLPCDEEEIQPFRFRDLPRKVQLKILSYVLVFKGEVIHAISRLDPYYEPSSEHVNCNQRLSLLHRFHIGNEKVSLTLGTIHPQKLLAPLLVCKEWHLLGSTLFYGANKFAFSSIGE
ncbi:hypothetical protein IL306_013879 [Fusarium sp. DS 682]|nr:hypothetical protein IL306_013879 [Fusarium sp. DS 682]